MSVNDGRGGGLWSRRGASLLRTVWLLMMYQRHPISRNPSERGERREGGRERERSAGDTDSYEENPHSWGCTEGRNQEHS